MWNLKGICGPQNLGKNDEKKDIRECSEGGGFKKNAMIARLAVSVKLQKITKPRTGKSLYEDLCATLHRKERRNYITIKEC